MHKVLDLKNFFIELIPINDAKNIIDLSICYLKTNQFAKIEDLKKQFSNKMPIEKNYKLILDYLSDNKTSLDLTDITSFTNLDETQNLLNKIRDDLVTSNPLSHTKKVVSKAP